MDIIETVDAIASYYPVLDTVVIDGLAIKYLVNFDRVYKLKAPLGKGSYGTVQCYKERATGYLYALKEIEITEQTDIRILQEEISVLDSLSSCHPSIVKYHDSFVYMRADRPIYVIVTDYIEGITLHQYINTLISQNQMILPATILNLALWLLSVVAEIHAAGYVHQDIKPENIMIDTDRNRFVLIDFGLTFPLKTKFADRTRIYRTIGTSEFIAPERWVLKKRSTFSFRSPNLSILKKVDIWAVAVTLYCVMEKRYPWIKFDENSQHFDILSIGQQVISAEPIPFTYPDPEVVRIISMMLHRDPELRPSAERMVTTIKEYLRKEAVFDDLPRHPEDAPVFNLPRGMEPLPADRFRIDLPNTSEIYPVERVRAICPIPRLDLNASVSPRSNKSSPRSDHPSPRSALVHSVLVHSEPSSPRSNNSSPRSNNSSPRSDHPSPRSALVHSDPFSARSDPSSPNPKSSPRHELLSNLWRRFQS